MPAFPRPASLYASGLLANREQDGMSLRDYFAGQVLAGIMSVDRPTHLAENWVPRAAYRIADAMLDARGAGPEGSS